MISISEEVSLEGIDEHREADIFRTLKHKALETTFNLTNIIASCDESDAYDQKLFVGTGCIGSVYIDRERKVAGYRLKAH